jgi:hypothetical protein
VLEVLFIEQDVTTASGSRCRTDPGILDVDERIRLGLGLIVLIVTAQQHFTLSLATQRSWARNASTSSPPWVPVLQFLPRLGSRTGSTPPVWIPASEVDDVLVSGPLARSAGHLREQVVGDPEVEAALDVDALERTERDVEFPVLSPCGFLLISRTTPPIEPRPNSVPCGPRNTSTAIHTDQVQLCSPA